MHYEQVPKELVENLAFRKYVLEKALNDRLLQVSLVEACRRDILFYVNVFGWTYDPRLSGSKAIPFVTYPFQDRAFREVQSAIDDAQNFLFQKSRDMGASWINVYSFDHKAQFFKDNKFLALSRTAALVDSEDADSLFWKLRFIHKWLPPWMLNWEDEKQIQYTKMKVMYKKTNSQITGASTTKASGVGGRATAVFIDEFSLFDPVDARLVKSGMHDVSDCCIYNFTPNQEMGKAHPSYELVDQAEKGKMRSILIHWREHPKKAKGLHWIDKRSREVKLLDKSFDFGNYKFDMDGVFEWHSPWFDAERIRRGNDRDVKFQLEVDWEGSGFKFFDEDMLAEYSLQNARPPLWEGELEYDDDGDPKGFVKVRGGRIKLWADLDSGNRLMRAPYVAGADISLGVGTTNSCFSAARVDTGEKVLELATPHMDPKEFAAICVALCRWLSSPGNAALFTWEKQGPGNTFGAEVVALGYNAVYFPEDELRWSKKKSKTPGCSPTGHAKRTWLLAYQSGLSTRAFLNRSKEALTECFAFVNSPTGPKHQGTLNKSEDPSGAEDNHGDRVIADALCYKMLVERGGGLPAEQEEKQKAPPVGSMAWIEQQDAKDRLRSRELYSGWSGVRY